MPIPKKSDYQLTGITFERHQPKDLTYMDWSFLKDVALAGFESVLPAGVDVEEFLHAKRVEDFELDHVKPNTPVKEGRLFKNQSFSHPELTIAYCMGRPVGYTFLAQNVSGHLRAAKRLVRPYNWLTFREMAVMPNYGHRGIAHVLAALAVHGKSPHRKVSAYVYDQMPIMQQALHDMGFAETACRTLTPSGFSEPTNMHRLVTTVNKLEAELVHLPKAEEEYRWLKPSMGFGYYDMPRIPVK